MSESEGGRKLFAKPYRQTGAPKPSERGRAIFGFFEVQGGAPSVSHPLEGDSFQETGKVHTPVCAGHSVVGHEPDAKARMEGPLSFDPGSHEAVQGCALRIDVGTGRPIPVALGVHVPQVDHDQVRTFREGFLGKGQRFGIGAIGAIGLQSPGSNIVPRSFATGPVPEGDPATRSGGRDPERLRLEPLR